MLQRTIHLYQNAYSGLSKEVWLLSLISFVNRAGAMVFPFMTIYLTQSMHFSLKEAGFIMGAFGLGSVLGAYIGGWLTDRYGNYLVQFWSLLLTGAVLVFILKAETFWEMMGMAFLLSTAADAFRPANKVAVANYSRPENLTRSFALLRLAVNLGFAIGPAMGGILAAWKGYDWLFYADAITCILAAILFRLTLKEKPKAVDNQSSIPEAPRAPLTSAFKDRFFLVFLLVMVAMAFIFLQVFYTMPVFLKQELGIAEGEIGLFLGLNGLVIVLLEMPLVYLAEQRLTKFQSMAGGALLIGLGFLLFVVSQFWLGVAALAIITLTLGEIYYMPFASAFTAERANDQNRGQYMALYTMSWAVASIMSPTIGFFLAENLGFLPLWIILFAIGGMGGIGFWRLGRVLEKRQPVSL